MATTRIGTINRLRRSSRTVGIGLVTLGLILSWLADAVTAGMTLFGIGAVLIVLALFLATGPMPAPPGRR